MKKTKKSFENSNIDLVLPAMNFEWGVSKRHDLLTDSIWGCKNWRKQDAKHLPADGWGTLMQIEEPIPVQVPQMAENSRITNETESIFCTTYQIKECIKSASPINSGAAYYDPETNQHVLSCNTDVVANMEGSMITNNGFVNKNLIFDGRVTPYATMEKVLKCCYFKVLNGCLYYFDGVCYVYLSPETAKRLILHLCREDIAERGTAKHTQQVYDLLLIEPRICVDPASVSNSLIAFDNGMYDVEKGTLCPHSREFFVTFRLNCNYTPANLECPWFDYLLQTISGGDQMITKRIWEMFAYCLTPDISAKKIFVLQGVSNSGKSLLCLILEALFPEEFVASLNLHELEGTFALSELIGRRICFFHDMPATLLEARSASVLKQLSGGDLVSADVKFQPRVKFRCNSKFILATNHPIRLRQPDEAFADRLVVIPFLYAIPNDKIDRQLFEKIFTERNAIVSRALAHYADLVHRNYDFSGDFRINEMGFSSVAEPMGLDEEIQSFLVESFYASNDAMLFIDDAHALFLRNGHNIPINTFASVFADFASIIFGATKTRKRKYSGANPQSCMVGIGMKAEVII